jgi:hypothetical protein
VRGSSSVVRSITREFEDLLQFDFGARPATSAAPLPRIETAGTPLRTKLARWLDQPL